LTSAEDDKSWLLTHLQNQHGHKERKEITLQTKQTSEIKKIRCDRHAIIQPLRSARTHILKIDKAMNQ
jgi:hypothetical protein